MVTSIFFTTERTHLPWRVVPGENTEIFLGESKKDSVSFVCSVVN
jgi:hypothetical protein